MEVLTTHPGLLQLETRGDRCHLGKDREWGGRGCWASTYSSPGHRAAPPGPEPGGPRQPALPAEVTRLGSIGLQCREVIWEDEGALVLGVHLPGRESGSGADGAVGEPGRLGPWWYLAVGPGGPRAKRVVGVPAGDILRGWLLQLPLPGSLHPVGRHQHPVIPQRVVTSVLVLCGERRAGRQGGRNAGRRPPPPPPPAMPPPRVTLREGLHPALSPLQLHSFLPASGRRGGFPAATTTPPPPRAGSVPRSPPAFPALGWALPGFRREAQPPPYRWHESGRPPPLPPPPAMAPCPRRSRKPRR